MNSPDPPRPGRVARPPWACAVWARAAGGRRCAMAPPPAREEAPGRYVRRGCCVRGTACRSAGTQRNCSCLQSCIAAAGALHWQLVRGARPCLSRGSLSACSALSLSLELKS